MDHIKVRCHLCPLDILLVKLSLGFRFVRHFNFLGVYIFQELLTMRSDAPFRDAKAKLMEIRQEQSKRSDRSAAGDNKRKKKKPKASPAQS
jgi:hypothetical protein